MAEPDTFYMSGQTETITHSEVAQCLIKEIKIPFIFGHSLLSFAYPGRTATLVHDNPYTVR